MLPLCEIKYNVTDKNKIILVLFSSNSQNMSYNWTIEMQAVQKRVIGGKTEVKDRAIIYTWFSSANKKLEIGEIRSRCTVKKNIKVIFGSSLIISQFYYIFYAVFTYTQWLSFATKIDFASLGSNGKDTICLPRGVNCNKKNHYTSYFKVSI